jgi:predicted XRE-type DNA-binding protein
MRETDFEEGSGNVFADLGFSPDDAEELTAKSTLILAIKAVMTERTLTQKQAAKVCGTDQPTLSKVLHGRMESVTLDRLAHWLTALGQDVEITVRPAPATRHARLHVAAAA